MKTRKTPMRRCVGCMESKPKNSMIRVACYEGELTVDPTGRAPGRGVYLCRDSKCMALARKKKALQRNLHVELSEEQLDRVFEELAQYEE
ncbi:MAG: YlxR family protein [Firmicutes bacterium]|nr:YlxR family protein [Bacillota bacterium]